jgi:competence protein ComEA
MPCRNSITGTMNRAASFAVNVAAVVLVLTIPGAMQDRFPNGPGKAELVKVCSGCHEAETILAHAQTAGEWAKTLETMVQLGAQATPDEWRLIEQYLDANYALIQINLVAADEIRATMDVTQAVADAIVKYRQEKGRFKSLDDLKKVPDLDAAKVDALRDRLIF